MSQSARICAVLLATGCCVAPGCTRSGDGTPAEVAEAVETPALAPRKPVVEPAPDILVLVLDTTRSDVFGWDRPDAGLTPNLDAFAARGTVFTNALAVSSWTPPNHASILTGLPPRQHLTTRTWLSESFTRADSESKPLGSEQFAEVHRIHQVLSRLEEGGLAEALADRGYRTGMFPTNPYLFSLNDAFDVKPEVANQGWSRIVDDTETVRLFKEFLVEETSPVFALVNLLGAHGPYEVLDAEACSPHDSARAFLADHDWKSYAEPDVVRFDVDQLLERWEFEHTPKRSATHVKTLLIEHGFLQSDHQWFSQSFFELPMPKDIPESIGDTADRILLHGFSVFVRSMNVDTSTRLWGVVDFDIMVNPSTERDGLRHVITPEVNDAVQDAYLCGLRGLDRSAGEVLDAFLQKHPDGYIVVVSDHGEAFGDGHEGLTFYNHAYPTPGVLKVPLILVGPGIPSGKTVDAPVQNFDIYPTVLEWAGAPQNDKSAPLNCDIRFQSESLNPLLTEPTSSSRVRLSETYPGTLQSFSFLETQYDCVWFSAEQDGLLVMWADSDLENGPCSKLQPLAFSLSPTRNSYKDIYSAASAPQAELLALGRACLSPSPVTPYLNMSALQDAVSAGDIAIERDVEDALKALGYF